MEIIAGAIILIMFAVIMDKADRDLLEMLNETNYFEDENNSK
jgi:hypothetical protein